jgi:hypothetical protein
MDKATFNAIRRVLHPDSRQSISDKKLGEGFDTFMALEKYVLNEKDSPTKFAYPDGSEIPSNLAEWDRGEPLPRRQNGPPADRQFAHAKGTLTRPAKCRGKGPGALSIPGSPTSVLHHRRGSLGRTQPHKSFLGATVPLQIASAKM